MTDKYILTKNKRVVPCNDLLKWAKWFETADRLVEKTAVGEGVVSTVFLGIDHNFGGRQKLLFETMIFGGPLDGSQWRYKNWTEARKGHKKAVDLAIAKQS